VRIETDQIAQWIANPTIESLSSTIRATGDRTIVGRATMALTPLATHTVTGRLIMLSAGERRISTSSRNLLQRNARDIMNALLMTNREAIRNQGYAVRGGMATA
jgi:hypothetical protein